MEELVLTDDTNVYLSDNYLLVIVFFPFLLYFIINYLCFTFPQKTNINPLVTDPLYLVCMAKILIKKKKRSSKKFPMSVTPMSR